MSLIYCPECGHEISNSAVACPNCGRPISAEPVVEREVVVAHHRPRGVPTWAIATVGIMGVLLLFFIFFLFTRGGADDANENTRLRVNLNGQGRSTNRDTVASTNEPSTVTSVPAAPNSVNIPPSSMPSTETPVSGSQVSLPVQPTKGTAVIQAKVITKNNTQQPVRGQRFYLLDKDVEQILTEAHVDPIEGNTLTGSLGLAAAMPDRYGDFQRRAMLALKNHIKYAGTTDSNGRAQLGDISPNSYYLFGVVRSGNGFAIWSSPVAINPGENVLDLAPQSITEIDRSSGEE